MGGTELVFSRGDAPLAAPALAATRIIRDDSANPDASTQRGARRARPRAGGAAAADRLQRAAAATATICDRILESLMDEVIEVTRADKGFLILMEGERACG